MRSRACVITMTDVHSLPCSFTPDEIHAGHEISQSWLATYAESPATRCRVSLHGGKLPSRSGARGNEFLSG
jgi:hypothetical protein